MKPEPLYKNDKALAYWDVLVYADSIIATADRIDARIVDKVTKKVMPVETTSHAPGLIIEQRKKLRRP